MKLKKVLVLPVLALAATCFLTACGTKKDSKKEEVKEIKMSDIKDDAVSEKTKVVDGEEVTEYTTKDGNVIQIPTGNEEDIESKDSGGADTSAKN
ncbi:ABC transporter [Streptococcus dysgalactiae subsp. equisimilis]|nr:ABC transporter [Streptococcus dysgalactiae subsp. equisimilis]